MPAKFIKVFSDFYGDQWELFAKSKLCDKDLDGMSSLFVSGYFRDLWCNKLNDLEPLGWRADLE